mmetsp:Transcript_32666/g.76944  ORF Transcript_32666/g.76944 Transcript_32666/m.76944 type:complete len:203 (-) Transcript_32666:448-1056(-)
MQAVRPAVTEPALFASAAAVERVEDVRLEVGEGVGGEGAHAEEELELEAEPAVLRVEERRLALRHPRGKLLPMHAVVRSTDVVEAEGAREVLLHAPHRRADARALEERSVVRCRERLALRGGSKGLVRDHARDAVEGAAQLGRKDAEHLRKLRLRPPKIEQQPHAPQARAHWVPWGRGGRTALHHRRRYGPLWADEDVVVAI